jgi:hypothetical protein
MKKRFSHKSLLFLNKQAWLLLFCVITASLSCVKKSIPTTTPPLQQEGSTSTATLNLKKGLGMTLKTTDWLNKVKAVNVSWHYSWGSVFASGEPASVEYVPMIWGQWFADSTLTSLQSLAKQGEIKNLLGFNEPDNLQQANMTVQQAIALWPKLMSLNIPLGSPAAVNALGPWMQNFMHIADSLHYRIDFIPVHLYVGTSADNFMSTLKQIHDLYGRPIWITEFAVADWNAKSLSQNQYSTSAVLQFMKTVLPRLDTVSYVQRYAWFSASTSDAHLGTSGLFNNDGSLTTLGSYYANHN